MVKASNHAPPIAFNVMFEQVYNMSSPPRPLPIDPFLQPFDAASETFDNVPDMPHFVEFSL